MCVSCSPPYLHLFSHHTTPYHNTQHHTTTHHTTQHHTTPHHNTPHLTSPHHTTPQHNTTQHTSPHHTTPHESSGLAEKTCTAVDGSAITSGGGFSLVYARPSWQATAAEGYLSATQQTFSGNRYVPVSSSVPMRGLPDISLMGNSYIVAIGGRFYSLSGTSASSPALAVSLSFRLFLFLSLLVLSREIDRRMSGPYRPKQTQADTNLLPSPIAHLRRLSLPFPLSPSTTLNPQPTTHYSQPTTHYTLHTTLNPHR